MWVWRDDMGSGGARGGAARPGGWRLDAYDTWVWEEPSLLERPGAGTDALRRASARGARPARDVRPTGDRAIAAIGHEPTPIFHELTVDRSREPYRGPRRDRDAVHVPEPHPGSGPLPVQDPSGGPRGRRLGDVPTVPPPADPAGHDDVESPEEELRRRAERRRRPLTSVGRDAVGRDSAGRDEERESGRHTWRREEVRTGRHALRR